MQRVILAFVLCAIVAPREALLSRLDTASRSGHFFFGQQHSTIWGMWNDRVVPTNEWFAAKRFVSDASALTGADPAVLGVDIGMLAFDPPEWQRRPIIAEAMRRHLARGGIVSLDWHPPSCTGTAFYAEDGYTKPIRQRADVPEGITCLCRLVNESDVWLTTRVKEIAAALRDGGLADAAMIVRPFHEQNGDWFWWGEPYWNCAALLGDPQAISGPQAYKAVVRTFITTLRNEPGMANLVFASSPNSWLSRDERTPLTPGERTLLDPMMLARNLLRERLVAELTVLGLAYAPKRTLLPITRVKTAAEERRYVTEHRALIAEAYPGDDVIDILAVDHYFSRVRTVRPLDRLHLVLTLRAVREEAAARKKVHALSEVGTYRLHLATLKPPFTLASAADVAAAQALLFDPVDRARVPSESFVTKAIPHDDWFTKVLLPIAKDAGVAYALVWQTYNAGGATYPYYFVPYPGHPAAADFQRFARDPVTCFVGEPCGPRE